MDKNSFVKIFIIIYPVFALIAITILILKIQITTAGTIFLVTSLVWIAMVLYVIVTLYLSENC